MSNKKRINETVYYNHHSINPLEYENLIILKVDILSHYKYSY